MGVLAGAALEKVGEDSLKPAFQSGSSRPLAEWNGAGVHGGRSFFGSSISAYRRDKVRHATSWEPSIRECKV